jgi:hypothetical protein
MQTAASAAIASRQCEHVASAEADGKSSECEYLLALPEVQRLVQLEEWLEKQNLFYVWFERGGGWQVEPAPCP